MACEEDEGGCVTLNWEIQNVGLFFSLEDGVMCYTPFWNTMHIGKSVLRRQRIQMYITGSCIVFRILATECLYIDRCETSLISPCMEVPLKLDNRGLICWSYAIERDAVFGEERQSIFPNDTLTLRCKMWGKTMWTREYRINSVLHSFSYLWNIENFEPNYNYEKYIGEKSFLFQASLGRKRGKATHRFTFGEVSSKRGDVSLLNIKLSEKCSRVSVIDKNFLPNDYMCKINISRNSTSLNFQLESVFSIHKVTRPLNLKLPLLPRFEKVSGSLGNDLLLLYRDQLFSDATLNAEGKSFPVHRSILSARSPVFRAMFEKDEMKEGRSGVVDIDDVDSETLDRMLVYLYRDSLINVQQWEETSALYYAADKYDIQPLKHKCARSLEEGLTVNNACESLILANRHSDDQLIRGIVDFIRQNEELLSSEKWDSLENSNPLLAAKVLRKIICKNIKK